VQSELLLDSVKVVHNDLSDADVEVVPIKSRTADKRPCRCCAPEKPWEYLGADVSRNGGLTNGKPMHSAGFRSQNSDGGGGAERAKPNPGGRYADGTLGGAGHAESILAASSPTGWLFGCDRDGAAIEAAKKRLAEKLPDVLRSGREILRKWGMDPAADATACCWTWA